MSDLARRTLGGLAAVLALGSVSRAGPGEPSRRPTPSCGPTLVRCVDAAGRPVVGARVHLFVHSEPRSKMIPCDPLGDESPEKGRAEAGADPSTDPAERPDVPRTDALGCRAFVRPAGGDRGIRIAYARIPGHLVGVAKDEGPTDDALTIVMQPVVPVAGTVVVPPGFDPSSVRVRVTVLTHEGDRRWLGLQRYLPGLTEFLPGLFEAAVDGHARFVIPEVPIDARLYLAADGPGLGHTEAYCVAPTEATLVSFDMPEEGVLRGRLLDGRGRAVSGGRVQCKRSLVADRPFSIGESVEARTGPEGEFRFDGLHPGSYDLVAEGGVDWACLARRFETGAADEEARVVMQLERGVVVHGRLSGLDGVALPFERISARDVELEGCKLGFTLSDERGRYRLRLPRKKVALIVSTPKGRLTAPLDLIGFLEDSRALDLQLGPDRHP